MPGRSGWGFCRLLAAVGGLLSGGGERLAALAAVAVDRDRLEPQLPGVGVGLLHVFGGGVLGQVDRLADGPRDERLDRGHHPHMPLPADRALAVGGWEGAVEDGEIVLAMMRGALDGVVLVDVGQDGGDRLLAVAQLEQRRGYGPI